MGYYTQVREASEPMSTIAPRRAQSLAAAARVIFNGIRFAERGDHDARQRGGILEEHGPQRRGVRRPRDEAQRMQIGTGSGGE